jgi:hypothetical protein
MLVEKLFNKPLIPGFGILVDELVSQLMWIFIQESNHLTYMSG